MFFGILLLWFCVQFACGLLQDRDLQPWAGWWGQNPLSGEAFLHINIPPGRQAAFKRCHLWNTLLPDAQFV